MKTNKDFWDMSWNPVWGCLNNCPYCYARRKAKRYAEQVAEKEFCYFDNLEIKKHGRHLGYYSYDYFDKTLLQMRLEEFKPTWLELNHVRKFPKKPSIIFVNSMSDPAYWEQEWYEKIVKRIIENMQHTFIVLTKQPEIYKKYTFPHNTILGVTCVNQQKLNELDCMLSNNLEFNNRLLVSIEPIQEKIKINGWMKKMIDWIHVGEESGNRKDKVRATQEMIQPFFDLDIPVFMKNNLTGIIPGMKLRKEFPEL